MKGQQVIPLTRQLLSEVVANFRKRKARGVDSTAGDVVVDYEHASESLKVARGGPVPAAGWLKDIESQPDANGILWGLVEFTETARTAIERKELRYVSPLIDSSARDKVTGQPQGPTLTSVALTNRPFQEWLPAIALSDGWTQEPSEGKVNDLTNETALAVRNAGSGGEYEVLSLSEIGKLDEQINQMVKARSSATGVSYREGLSEVARQHPGLFKARERLLNKGTRAEVFVWDGSSYVSIEDHFNESKPRPFTQAVNSLITEKIAANQGSTYRSAMISTAKEHPVLWGRYRRETGDEG
ncbi:MAG: phage protease [Acidobacteriia bacterium]|nr:phage protease [Terriglobia bacterium]